MTQPILVTGGTGTLGRAVVARMLAAGHQVRVLSRRNRPAGGPAVTRTRWVMLILPLVRRVLQVDVAKERCWHHRGRATADRRACHACPVLLDWRGVARS
jgi:nucleoside-diphosphate-sugar epimerase